MSNPAVRTEHKDAVTTVILARPEVRNAVDRPTAEALAEAFLAFERDDSRSVAVLWGAGGTFCAGADLKAVAEGRGNRTRPPGTGAGYDPLAGDAPMGPTRLLLSKPVIAAVAGHAVAGGLELACWCDLRVVEESAVFGVFCRRWGVPLIDGGTVRLPRLIGQSRALDMILPGRPVGAMEAFAWGLANRVVKTGEARAEAEKLAHELARLPQTCLRSDRLSVYEQFGQVQAEAMAGEFAHGMKTLQSAEALEGAARFAEGRGRGGRFDDL
ncbi:MAG: crotonase/enoyl-CoA hydratase family protein [Alphaproteobacteria bacterium]|nr:crotonase/enoyl-CoA hydratase family protein [Alphaproteobacteria bacterium]